MQSIKYRTALVLGMTGEVCGALFLGEHDQLSTPCTILGDPDIQFSSIVMLYCSSTAAGSPLHLGCWDGTSTWGMAQRCMLILVRCSAAVWCSSSQCGTASQHPFSPPAGARMTPTFSDKLVKVSSFANKPELAMACSTMAVWVAALSMLAAARAGLPLAPNQALGEMRAEGVSASGLKPALHNMRHTHACNDQACISWLSRPCMSW